MLLQGDNETRNEKCLGLFQRLWRTDVSACPKLPPTTALLNASDVLPGLPSSKSFGSHYFIWFSYQMKACAVTETKRLWQLSGFWWHMSHFLNTSWTDFSFTTDFLKGISREEEFVSLFTINTSDKTNFMNTFPTTEFYDTFFSKIVIVELTQVLGINVGVLR